MFKRTIFILILLTIAFFIFRGVNPTGAAKFVDNIRNAYHRMIGTTWTILNAKWLTWELFTGATFTGTFSTGGLLTGWWDDTGSKEPEIETSDTDTVTPSLRVDTQTSTTTPSPSIITNKAITTVQATPKWLSSKDVRDTQNLLQNLFR